jgi:O-antigen/teichoic acid export membrane protein
MRFGAMAMARVLSLLVAGLVAIVCALVVRNYWALVAMHAARAATFSVLLWLFCKWRPGLPSWSRDVGEMVNFGLNFTGARALNLAVRHMDNLLIGRVWGAAALGLYSRAYRLLLLPLQQVSEPISQVAIPALSRLQDEPMRFRRFYKKAMLLAATVTIPIVLFAFICADKIVLLVLGEQWLKAIPLFRALAPAALLGSLNIAAGWVLLPLGRSARQMRTSFIGAVCSIGAFFIGLPYGAFGVALAFSISFVISRPLQLLYAFHGSPVRMADLGDAIWQPVFAGLCAAGATTGLKMWWSTGCLALDLLLFALLYALVYLITWSRLPGFVTLKGVAQTAVDGWMKKKEPSQTEDKAPPLNEEKNDTQNEG